MSTDGDIVLVTGANGLGKSSLLEAIILLLTNYRVNRPPKGEPSEWGRLAHLKADGWRLQAEVSLAGEPIIAEARWPAPDREAQPEHLPRDDVWWTQLREKTERNGRVPSDLLATAISFFQDDPRTNLDDAERTVTLLDWMWVIAPALQELRRQLPGLRADARREEADNQNERRALSTPSPRLYELFESTKQKVIPFASKFGVLEPPYPEPVMWLQSLTWAIEDAAYKVGRRGMASDHSPSLGGASITRRLLTACENLAGQASELSRELLERRLREAQDELHALDGPKGPMAVLDWAKAWKMSSPAEPARIDSVLGSLSDNIIRWLIDGIEIRDPRLEPLLRELSRLDFGTLSALSGTVHAIISDAERLVGRRAEIETTIQRIELELSKSGVPEDLRTAVERLAEPLQDDLDRQNKLSRLPDAQVLARIADGIGQLEQLIEGMLSDRAEGELESLLAKVLDNTLVRFLPREGFLPVRLVKRYDSKERKNYQVLTTGDNRPWSDASTGQKAQLSLAWMLAHALALREQLPARILVLDDTSTAFDTGNLARQVTWLRQLAYHPDPKQRWQIFMASHHDELTSRLVKLLRPPEGRTLRVLEFKGWTPNIGPDVQEWELKFDPSQISGDPPERLQRALDLVWAEPLPARKHT